jgi:hypothetical protein
VKHKQVVYRRKIVAYIKERGEATTTAEILELVRDMITKERALERFEKKYAYRARRHKGVKKVLEYSLTDKIELGKRSIIQDAIYFMVKDGALQYVGGFGINRKYVVPE